MRGQVRHSWRHSRQECLRYVCSARFHDEGVQGLGKSTTDTSFARNRDTLGLILPRTSTCWPVKK